MVDLLDLYKNRKNCNNPVCQGCSILDKPKPIHAHMDYAGAEQTDVLFLMDSLRWGGFEITNLSDKGEEAVFKGYVNPIIKKYAVAAAIKCPDVKEEDMSPANMEICRNHLQATIDQYKPKLIFTCGNLAMKMLIKKSGITNKRGKTFDYNGIPVIPILHPASVSIEPKLVTLFQQDIRNGYNKYILKKDSELVVPYEIIMSLEQLENLSFLYGQTDNIAVDIETTGLDFKKDSIMTIAISYKQDGELKQAIIPYIHKESPFSVEDRKQVAIILNKIFNNPNNKKILQNAKFDLKFLYGQGITFTNVWDTKLVSHFIREDAPKSLMDLVKQYFPEYLKEF